jgi:hypothetical protein
MKPQFEQRASRRSAAKPQLGQVVGWTAPSGAPQAMQLPSPTGLAVAQ